MEDFMDSLKESKLSSKEMRQLVEKFLACPIIGNRHSRDAVVKQLDDQILHAIARNAVDKVDVMNIVETCLNFSNGLQELVDAVGFFEGDSTPMQQLRAFVQSLFFVSQIISRELFGEIIKIVSALFITKEKLLEMYRSSVPVIWDGPSFRDCDEARMLTLMLQDLAKMDRQTTGVLPFLKFVKLLARVTKYTSEQSVQDAFVVWIQKVSEEVGIDEGEDLSEEETISSAQSSRASFHLLVKFEANRNKEGEFNVCAWLIEQKHEKTTCLVKEVVLESGTYNVGVECTLLRDWIMQCEEYTPYFTIELFLPFAFLNNKTCDVHQWRCDLDFGHADLITRTYPLVLRSYDRVYSKKPKTRYNWINNWNICKVSLNVVPVIVKKEEGDLLPKLERAVCSAMTFVPPNYDSKSLHIFKQMMIAGTSVALWPRVLDEDLNEDMVEEAYRTLLAGCNFSAIPERILEIRKNANVHKVFSKNNLALLWDNPYRLPPDLQLHAPHQKGSK